MPITKWHGLHWQSPFPIKGPKTSPMPIIMVLMPWYVVATADLQKVA